MSFIQVDKPRGHVTLVTLNRPDRMNAMAFDVMIPLRDALRDISNDNDCRVVVLTGAGHGFCSGADRSRRRRRRGGAHRLQPHRGRDHQAGRTPIYTVE